MVESQTQTDEVKIIKQDIKDKLQIGKMKGGDYLVHVFIQDGHSFKLDGKTVVNPLVEVSFFGQTQFTTSKKDIPCQSSNTVLWKEHIFFEVCDTTSFTISTQTLSIILKNKGNQWNEVIGSYLFDISTIYFKDRHTIEHQWLTLTNTQAANLTSLCGLLRVSISVQNAGDEQVKLQHADLFHQEVQQIVTIPPQLQWEYKQLRIRFLVGESFYKVDQAYIKMKFNSRKFYSSVAKLDTENKITFDFEFLLPLEWPTTSDRLVIKVFSKNKNSFHTSKDDQAVGSMGFSLKEIIKDAYKQGGIFFWKSIHGSPYNSKGQEAEKMDNNPELASTWKGRIMMNLELQDCQQPEMRQEVLNPEITKNAIARKMFNLYEYQFLIQIGFGIQLPGGKKKFKVKVKIGDFERICEPVASQDGTSLCQEGYCRYSQRFEMTTEIMPFSSIEQMGNVWLYLMDDEKPICYYQAPAIFFIDPNPQQKWCIMQADKALGEIKDDYNAGAIQLKMSINDIAKNGVVDFMKYSEWKRKPKRRPQLIKVRCFIFQCREVPAADENGLSDCYIQLWNQDGKEIQTKPIFDSLNPVFYETKDIEIEFDYLEDCPPIILNLWDKNDITQGDKYLGKAVITLKDASINQFPKGKEIGDTLPPEIANQVPIPKWHDFKLGRSSSPSVGQVLCSFILAANDQVFPQKASEIDLRPVIPSKVYNIDINAFGLRNLLPHALMPIKKPFIKFHIKSLLPYEQAMATNNIITEPTPGSDANINQSFSIRAQLPNQTEFCPLLTCDVFDQVQYGAAQPLLGTFYIDLGQFRDQMFQRKQIIINEAKLFLDYLKNHLNRTEAEVKHLKSQVNNYETDPLLNDLIQRKKDQQKQQQKEEEKKQLDSKTYFKNPFNGVKVTKATLLEPLLDDENPEFIQVRKLQQDDSLQIKLKQMEKQLLEMDIQLSEQIAASEVLLPIHRRSLVPIQEQQQRDLLIKSLKDNICKLQFLIQQENYRIQDYHRKADQIVLKELNRYQSGVFVIVPQYKKCPMLNFYVEDNIPPESLYMPIGFNSLQTVNQIMEVNDTNRILRITNKHYRKFYPEELEKVKTLFPIPVFIQLDILRGDGRDTYTPSEAHHFNKTKVGEFKGLIEVWNVDERHEIEKGKKDLAAAVFKLISQIYKKFLNKNIPYNIEILQNAQYNSNFWDEVQQTGLDSNRVRDFINKNDYAQIIKKQLNNKTACKVRLYVQQGIDFAKKDLKSIDPYLKVSLGDYVINERSKHQSDNCPKFNKMFEFQTTFPGASKLKIEAIDYDEIFGDELIGITTIDLDDRYFNPEWQRLEEKPIELRSIFHPSRDLPQGRISMWLEIDEKTSQRRIWNIQDEPTKEYQVRVCVYEIRNVPVEEADGSSDLYVKGYMDQDQEQMTDTHYRSTGDGTFNYRMVFDIKAPHNGVLVLQAWDRDLFTQNQVSCEWSLDLKKVLSMVRKSQQSVHINRQFYESNSEVYFKNLNLQYDPDGHSFWLTSNKNGIDVKIRLDIRVMPVSQALSCPAGIARTEPNMDPFLTPPIGRITANPSKFFSQFIDPTWGRQLYFRLAMIICLVLCLVMIPIILSNFFTNFVTWMFAKKQM